MAAPHSLAYLLLIALRDQPRLEGLISASRASTVLDGGVVRITLHPRISAVHEQLRIRLSLSTSQPRSRMDQILLIELNTAVVASHAQSGQSVLLLA